MDKNYGNVIWTNHVLQRLTERHISQADSWATWRNPDNSRYAASRSAWVYYRTIGGKKFEVVAKKNKQGQWVILSVWCKPVFKNKSKQSKSNSFWKLILNQLFW
ncbi:hypothetical protein A2160_00075 [Candidatus Beckwithbacteria bacterium RBG_13_42_9]|uniref:DUF4258 domain-containing protein n=1 Tax=Candidatus Beckwithbacteria bacterium RBG_13_42_9 TaxID=1797457 RepID=A0A1F5E530_9BACT|nr:MAG: hypothetical protein A2160_00075 [Candidatus Beckwithbacteria bacterium RBG_13_42_9]